MKKILYPLFYLTVLFSSCKSTNFKSNFEQIKQSYLYDFKMTYFKKLLLESFNHSSAIKEILLIDRSGYGEPILSSFDYGLIDSLVKISNKKMVKDSTQSLGRVGEGAEGKRIFDFALRTYESKWLDSLAKVRYKKYVKEQVE